MFTLRRFRSSAGARRVIAAVVASATVSLCGGAEGFPSEAPHMDRSPGVRPTSTAVPVCPPPRCWWVPTSRHPEASDV